MHMFCYKTVIPLLQVAAEPLQLPSFLQVLLALPLRSKPSSHVKVQVSPGLASPSSPSEQSRSPLSGAVSRAHLTSVGTKHNGKSNHNDQLIFLVLI